MKSVALGVQEELPGQSSSEEQTTRGSDESPPGHSGIERIEGKGG